MLVCGGDVFCLDGDCDKAQSGQSNDFGEAVSQLAALAAAGKDVAALNGVDVRAFTGQAKFCKDKAQSGQSNDFGEAVSQLAALAAAGKDVAALNGVDVRAFTGQAKFCKKAAAGYSNCCKDSGWGQDIGLARNFVRRLQPDTATAVRTAAGDRISGWPNAAVMKRPWLKQNQTN